MTREDRLEEGLLTILQWADAYPSDIFGDASKEDFDEARIILKKNGISLDALSASCMKHVLEKAKIIASDALREGDC
jgi:hypothetical protein